LQTGIGIEVASKGKDGGKVKVEVEVRRKVE
jgi:hypothetical protein